MQHELIAYLSNLGYPPGFFVNMTTLQKDHFYEMNIVVHAENHKYGETEYFITIWELNNEDLQIDMIKEINANEVARIQDTSSIMKK